MSASSPEDRVFRAFTRIGFLVALVAFLVVGSDVLLGQWITGYASGKYIFGTAALLAGICLGIFAVISAVGLAVAAAFTHWAIAGRGRGQGDRSSSLEVAPEHVVG